MTTVAQRRAWLAVGLLIALGMTGWGGMHVAGWTVGAVHRTSHRVLSGDVRALRVDAGAGDVTVLPASDGRVTVDSRSEGSLWMPRLHTSVEGSRVRVSGGCFVHGFGRCRVSIIVRVPPPMDVRVTASSGDVVASDLSGHVRLGTGSGDIEASGLTGVSDLSAGSGDLTADRLRGPVSLRTTAGDIDALALESARVRARATAGDVDLSFAAPPRDVDAGATAGDLDLAVPPGDAYAVDAESRAGSRDVSVTDDDGAPRSIRARATAGDIIIRYGR